MKRRTNKSGRGHTPPPTAFEALQRQRQAVELLADVLGDALQHTDDSKTVYRTGIVMYDAVQHVWLLNKYILTITETPWIVTETNRLAIRAENMLQRIAEEVVKHWQPNRSAKLSGKTTSTLSRSSKRPTITLPSNTRKPKSTKR